MYNSDLEELIAFYELEKRNLQTLIEECVKDMDYQLAEYHFQALCLVNRKLQTLQNFTDPNYDEKEWVKRQISFYQREVANSGKDYMQEFYNEKIKHFEANLFSLEQLQTKNEKTGVEFDNLVYDLFEGLISGFTFHLKKEENLCLKFTKDNNYLFVSFPPFTEISEYTFDEEKHLYALGFYMNKEENCYQYKYDLKIFRNVRHIKTLVSRIVFDIFYFKDLDLVATIEVY